MVGGADPDVERCRPVFETFGEPVIHLGPLGSGQMAKLMNNFVFTAQVGMALETYTFADRLGMDRATIAQVLAHGSGTSRAAAIVAGSGFATRGLSGAAPLLRKDVGIMLEVAAALGAAPPAALTEIAHDTLTTLENRPRTTPGVTGGNTPAHGSIGAPKRPSRARRVPYRDRMVGWGVVAGGAQPMAEAGSSSPAARP